MIHCMNIHQSLLFFLVIVAFMKQWCTVIFIVIVKQSDSSSASGLGKKLADMQSRLKNPFKKAAVVSPPKPPSKDFLGPSNDEACNSRSGEEDGGRRNYSVVGAGINKKSRSSGVADGYQQVCELLSLLSSCVFCSFICHKCMCM